MDLGRSISSSGRNYGVAILMGSISFTVIGATLYGSATTVKVVALASVMFNIFLIAGIAIITCEHSLRF